MPAWPLYFLFIGLVTFPLQLSGFQQYGVYPAHFTWFIAIPLSLAFLRNSQYFQSRTALYIWVIRLIAITEFLVVSLRFQSISLGDVFSLIGVIGPTFFFELGVYAATPKRYRVLLWALTICTLVTTIPAGIIGLYGLLNGGFVGLIYSTPIQRVLNPAWPNFAAIILAVCILAFGDMVGQEKKLGVRFIYITLLGLLGLTLSRTGILALVVGILFNMLFRGGKNKGRILLSAGLGAVILIIVFLGKSVLPQDTVQHTMDLRFARWVSAAATWSEHPVVGVGLRSFSKAVPQYYDAESGSFIDTGSAHNDYIDLLVRGGLLFLLPLLFVIGRHIYACLDQNKQTTISRAGPAILVAILVSAFVQQPLKHHTIVSVFWLFMGLTNPQPEVQSDELLLGD